nr:VTT domain-containing protein [Planctomycetota bacterium]
MSAQRRMRWGLVLIVVVIAAGGAAMMWAPLLDWARLIHDLVLSWGAWGVLGYILLFALWNLFLPPSPLQALAGFIYGVTGGLLITYAGATLALIGAVVAMRALSREGLEAMLQRRPMLRAIDRAVAASGWKAVILLRLCNLVPSTVANLALG